MFYTRRNFIKTYQTTSIILSVEQYFLLSNLELFKEGRE